jgi:hypothetical protein
MYSWCNYMRLLQGTGCSLMRTMLLCWLQSVLHFAEYERLCSDIETYRDTVKSHSNLHAVISVASFHLRLGVQSGLFHSSFQNKHLYTFLISSFLMHVRLIICFLICSLTVFGMQRNTVVYNR